MVSPALPSNSTLSGTTTAALPWGFNSVLMCCTKFNCLLDVVAQKSSRSMMSFLVEVLPSSPTIIVLDFLPNGGLASTASNRLPGSAASALAPDPQPFPPSIGILASLSKRALRLRPNAHTTTPTKAALGIQR